MQAQNKENTPMSTQIHNHITLPDNLFTMLQGQRDAGHDPVRSPSTLLLPNECQAGPTYTVDDFCHLYELDDKICTRLKDNGYARTHTFKYIETSELKTMGFKLGEIAELKEAVHMWAAEQH